MSPVNAAAPRRAVVRARLAPTRGLVATRGENCTRRSVDLARGPWRDGRLALVRTRRAALLVLATALPRLAALLHERGAILASFTDKGDNFAQTYPRDRDVRLHPGPSVRVHAAALRLVPDPALLDLRPPLGGRRARADLRRGRTTLIVWQIGKRWLTPTIGLLAGSLVALHPYLVWHDVHMNREILDHFVAAATVYLTLHAAERFGWRRALPLGAVIGVAILGNVRLEGLPIVLAAYLLWRAGISRRTLLATGALFAGAAVVVLPWVVRNKVSVGCWTVTTDARALWKANNVNTYVTLKHGGWIDARTAAEVVSADAAGRLRALAADRRRRAVQRVRADERVPEQGDLVLDSSSRRQGAPVPLDAQWLWQPSVVETRGRPGAGSVARHACGATAEPAYMIVLYILGAIGLFLVPRFFASLAVLAARLPDAHRDAVRRRDALPRAVGLPDRATRGARARRAQCARSSPSRRERVAGRTAPAQHGQ